MSAPKLLAAVVASVLASACLSLGDVTSDSNGDGAAGSGAAAGGGGSGGGGGGASGSSGGVSGASGGASGTSGGAAGGGAAGSGGSSGSSGSSGIGGGGESGGSGGAPTCGAGKADCNGNPADACETDLLTSTSHCGSCGNACNLPNAQAGCAGGICAVVGCNTGYGNCDGNPGNGCETPLTSLQHCGSCGVACTTAPSQSTPACIAASCGFTCNVGWGNCDNDPSDGCETLLTSDGANCGACGAKCAGTLVCSNGTCKLSG